MIQVLLRIESTGEMLGPFASWDEIASTVRRLAAEDAGKVTIFREHFVCDFCTSTDPRWLYEATDAVLGAIAAESAQEIHMTHGAWSACDPCHDLIEADEWGALIQRSAEGWRASSEDLGVPLAVVAEMIAAAHATFRRSRTAAPAQPIPTDADLGL